MPKINIDYSKCVIYKIVCNDLNVKDLYVGSTTNFVKRKQSHKNNCNCNENNDKHNLKIYKTIREIGGWENWSMVEIEKYSCNDKNEAFSRERFWLEKLDAKLNTLIPTRTVKEYYEDNKEKLKEYHEKWYIQNKTEVLEKCKLYRENNMEKEHERCKLYRENNKEKVQERSKLYRENNIEKIKARKKLYYENNKEKLRERIECICGSVHCKADLSRHKKSLQHINFIKSQESTIV